MTLRDYISVIQRSVLLCNYVILCTYCTYIYICTIVVLVNDETGFLFVNGHVSKDCSWGVSVLSAVVSEQKRV